MQIQHDRQWSSCRGRPVDSHANGRPTISARNIYLLAEKSSGAFSEGGPADETEHERREPSRVEKGCEHPPGGISAAQVFIHHVSGDFRPILRASSRRTRSI